MLLKNAAARFGGPSGEECQKADLERGFDLPPTQSACSCPNGTALWLFQRCLLLDVSVNVIASPVSVAPIPKPIVDVPTNISITLRGAWL